MADSPDKNGNPDARIAVSHALAKAAEYLFAAVSALSGKDVSSPITHSLSLTHHAHPLSNRFERHQ